VHVSTGNRNSAGDGAQGRATTGGGQPKTGGVRGSLTCESKQESEAELHQPRRGGFEYPAEGGGRQAGHRNPKIRAIGQAEAFGPELHPAPELNRRKSNNCAAWQVEFVMFDSSATWLSWQAEPSGGQFAYRRRRSAFCPVAPGPQTAGFASM